MAACDANASAVEARIVAGHMGLPLVLAWRSVAAESAFRLVDPSLSGVGVGLLLRGHGGRVKSGR